MLLPLYVLLTLCTLGSSLRETVCYGSKYSLRGFRYPFNMTVTYTPKVGKPKIVVKNGKAIDPRFRIFWSGAELIDVTEQDNEAVLSSETMLISSVELRVQNCRKARRADYGSSIFWVLPSAAEYLEFLKYTGSGIPSLVKPQVLWNRTDPSELSRGRIRGNEYEIKDITQQDSGYYRFRGSKNQLVKWEQIVIEHHEKSYDFDEGHITLEFPLMFTPSQVKFTRSYISQTISENNNRFRIIQGYFEIKDATPKDAGTYDFLDKSGNLMLHASVQIREVEKEWASYVSLAAFSFGGILCCCCVKKCCCKESSSKTDEPEDEAPASTAYHNDPPHSTQTASPLIPREQRVVIPDLPTYNAQGRPMDPPPPYSECVLEPSAPPVPAYSSLPDPPVSEPTASPPDPPQTNDVSLAGVITSPLDQVSTTGATEPTSFSSHNFNFTSVDSEPTFEFSGTAFSSAPPLSSEGTTSAEYNSDKLNFLS
ncbi:hypothetical protein NL108_014047 [Boleophthalmus pectinirostris]|uniref:uncharacterized protein LOC110160730 isoform X2 n=1 Tax=Boleophthalmus pectinirostris TaxID=150288 RepID=UPI002433293D|nr:uncharacterized protein LOC110160730 isoform X2 [Boleophthalmus pectinirostris]KAJ0039435.1 hypothetical protein NL108_014047 [Boleophthalmus pectinirostris]